MSGKTKKDQIVDLLREIILAGEWPPGERLLQAQLAERFDVSPTPIREAIQQLVAEGVLSHSPYKGVQVAEVTIEEMHEIYLLRSTLEALATRVAVPNLRIADVNRLHDYHAAINASVEAKDIATLRKYNYEFHWLIYDAAAMSYLSHIIRNLWLKSPWDTLYVLPTRPNEAIFEHDHILEAIDAGDAELAGERMREHIESGERTLSRYLSNQT